MHRTPTGTVPEPAAHLRLRRPPPREDAGLPLATQARTVLALLAIWALFAGHAGAQIAGASRLLRNASGENEAYSGIGRLTSPRTCTVFFVRPATVTETSPAYVVTAGHCIETGSANAVILDRAITGQVIFRYFIDTPDAQLAVTPRRVVYSTMKGWDLAVIELDRTFAQLVAAGIRPLEFLEGAASEVVNIAAPSSGIPAGEAYLRSSSCVLEPPVDLIEYIWLFRDALPNTCSDVKAGSSGSPVIDRATGKVVAVMNTTTADAYYLQGDFLCYANQPCEIATPSFRYRPDTNYAVPTAGLARCFDAQGRFGLTAPGCALDRGRQLTLSAPLRGVQPGARWNVRLSGDDFTHYRYKVIAEGQGDCQDSSGYGTPLRLSEVPSINDELPAAEGRYHLCVIGGDGAAVWQETRHASVVFTRVDVSPPTIPIPYQILETDTDYRFQPIFVLPELVDFSYRIVDGAGAACGNEGYRPFLRIPINVPRTSARFCLFGRDEAGNPTPILEFPLQGAQIFSPGVLNAASLRQGPSSPGATAAAFGVNLQQARVSLRDQSGRTFSIEPIYASPRQINFVLPSEAAPGEAFLSVDGNTTALDIAAVAPGIFTANGMGGGLAAGSAIRNGTASPLGQCASAFACEPLPVVLPTGEEDLQIEIFATGVSGSGRIAATISGVEVPLTRIEHRSGYSVIRARILSELQLRGILQMRIVADGVASNAAIIRLADR